MRFSEEYAKIKEKVIELTDERNEGKDMLNCKEISDDEAIRLAVNELHKINANPETRAHLEACDRYVRDMALTRGYAYNKGFKDRQPEVDNLRKDKEKAEARADEEKARADEEKARADKAIAGQTDMIRNMISNGMTREVIIGLTGITEEKYSALMQK